MITGITIENFKGIGDRVKLDLSPITLLFGANSAGKSTILHALHYAREILERHNLDADETVGGGEFVSLGGFQHFVHRNDVTGEKTTRDIVLKFDFLYPDCEMIDGKQVRVWGGDSGYMAYGEFKACREFLDDDLEALMWSHQYPSIELSIGWSNYENIPFVRRLVVYADDEVFGTIEASPNLREVVLIPNLDHPCLCDSTDWIWMRDPPDLPPQGPPPDSLLKMLLDECGHVVVPNDGQRFAFSGGGDALSVLRDQPFRFEEWEDRPLAEHSTKQQVEEARLEKERFFRHRDMASELTEAVRSVFIDLVDWVKLELSEFRYVGPLRETPKRNERPLKYPDPARWASGRGAWDALETGDEDLVEDVSRWLSDKDKLDAGYRLERQQFVELDLGDERVRRLYAPNASSEEGSDEISLSDLEIKSRLLVISMESGVALRPNDVGVGISQVIPVLVTALDGERRLLAIEQPELHLHPRLQAEIADLFIEAIHEKSQSFIIETHSEHLILRLLRRIRESSQTNEKTNRSLHPRHLSICYLKQENGSTTVRQIDVDKNGEFIQPWPDDFFEIDFNERFGIDKSQGEVEY